MEAGARVSVVERSGVPEKNMNGQSNMTCLDPGSN